MKICYNNEQVVQAIIELDIETVQLGYVGVDDMEWNLSHDLPAIKKFLSKVQYKAFRIYMLSEDVKNERQDEEIGYIITNTGKRRNVYYYGDWNTVEYYVEND